MVGRFAARLPPIRVNLLALHHSWLRHLEESQHLREIDPRLARDIGVSPGIDRCPKGFTVDPRPLWGIGLTPAPTCERRSGSITD
jgi:hypothetical protein